MRTESSICSILLHLDGAVLAQLDRLVVTANADLLATASLGGNTKEELDNAMLWAKSRQKTVREVNVWLRQQAAQRRKSNRLRMPSRTSVCMQLLRRAIEQELDQQAAAPAQAQVAAHV